MYVKIRRRQHTRTRTQARGATPDLRGVAADTTHIPRLVRRQAFLPLDGEGGGQNKHKCLCRTEIGAGEGAEDGAE